MGYKPLKILNSISTVRATFREKDSIAKKMAVSINGSGDVRLQQIESQECQASISGSGNINLNGKAIQASYSIAGSGNIQLPICKQKTQTQALAAPATSVAMPVRSWLPASKEAVILPIRRSSRSGCATKKYTADQIKTV